MNATQLEAFEAAARDGIDTPELTVEADDESFSVTIGSETFADLTATELTDLASRQDVSVSEWYFWHRVVPDQPDRRAFLRWIERADERPVADRRERLQEGLTREWGQLLIRAELGEDGRRVYELRHADDAGEPVVHLDRHTEPLDAREIKKRDEDGRYRPLSTAPTLPTGWVFADLGPAELVATVDAFYPATVANWHREREGELDVTHWHETVQRQTGIYGVVKTWDRGEGHEHVEWVAEACCDDSQCLKRREWEYDDETDLEAEGGDGEFPCREPCSLVIAGARKWTRIDAEETKSYEFELSPSEKEQLEEIVSAVADGRVEEIREADFKDGANRYRARFLRAKLFEDGDLCGVPTDGDD